ncbi:MAG: MMPL family transporter, partial [Planctomycetota bacterium]
VASWAVAEDDLGRMLPLLVLVVVVVPMVFFASAGAVLFPLVMAALTTAACLIAYRVFSGPLHALVMLLIPIVWSVATLDAMHLYYRVRRKAAHAGTDPVAAARAELYLPCLLTTLTTAGGLAALAVQGESRLMRSFGLWAAVGTGLAYLLTFTVGSAALSLSRRRRPLPRWPTRLVLSVVLYSQRRAGLVRVAWAGLLLAGIFFAARLEMEVRFPRIFAPDHPVARELRIMETLLGTDMGPLEIYVEPTDAHGRRHVPLASAAMSRPTITEAQLAELGKDPRIAPWVRFDRGAARLQVHFAPMTVARRTEIVRWLRHFDATMLSHHRLSLGGPAYHYLRAEQRGLRGAWIGGALALLVVGGALAWSFRGPRLLAIAWLGNLAPLVLVAGAMGVAGMPWSLAVLPLPAVLLGLAVDDTVHLLWPLRGRRPSGRRLIARGALRAGPALLATTVVLAGCVGTMTLSGLQVNRELGLLLPAGLLLALACDLSLVPALLTSSRRRSARPPP